MRDALLYKSQMHFRGGDTFTRLVRPTVVFVAGEYVCKSICMCVCECVLSRRSLSHTVSGKERNAFFSPNARAVNEKSPDPCNLQLDLITFKHY